MQFLQQTFHCTLRESFLPSSCFITKWPDQAQEQPVHVLAYNNHNILGEVTVKSLALVSYKHHVLLCYPPTCTQRAWAQGLWLCRDLSAISVTSVPLSRQKHSPLLTAVIINWRDQDIHCNTSQEFQERRSSSYPFTQEHCILLFVLYRATLAKDIHIKKYYINT